MYVWDSHTYTCSKSSDISLLIYTFMHVCISVHMSICLFLYTYILSAYVCVLRLRMYICLIKWDLSFVRSHVRIYAPLSPLRTFMSMFMHMYAHSFDVCMLARFIYCIWIRFWMIYLDLYMYVLAQLIKYILIYLEWYLDLCVCTWSSHNGSIPTVFPT